MKRKLFLFVTIICLSLGILAACSRKPNHSATNPETPNGTTNQVTPNGTTNNTLPNENTNTLPDTTTNNTTDGTVKDGAVNNIVNDVKDVGRDVKDAVTGQNRVDNTTNKTNVNP
ncbi:MAG: hypothetical protein RSB37_03275 [Acetivibrio sp.]